MEERAVVLIAYNYLCLLLGTLVLDTGLDFVRDCVRHGVPSPRLQVDHFTSRRYAPVHSLYPKVGETETVVEVVLFGWLVFDVHFRGVVYVGPDFVYVEDLKAGNGLIANTVAEAKAGEFYSTR